jgi:hypothetical protein
MFLEEDGHDAPDNVVAVMPLFNEAQTVDSRSPGRLKFVAPNILGIQYGICFVSPNCHLNVLGGC